MDLTGQVAVITGAVRGLGKGFTEILLDNGANVLMVDVDAAEGAAVLQDLRKRFPAERVKMAAADVSNQQQFRDAFNQAVSEWGHVDIMVNNAGLFDERSHEREISINYAAVVFGTYMALDHMRKDKGGRGGRIINVSSIAGLVDYLHGPVYCGTKHAVRAFSCSLALQPNLPDLGVQLAVLCPSATSTDQFHSMHEGKMHFYQLAMDQYRVLMPVTTVAEAFLGLLRKEKMNGDILFVEPGGCSYRRLENMAVQQHSL